MQLGVVGVQYYIFKQSVVTIQEIQDNNPRKVSSIFIVIEGHAQLNNRITV